MVSHYFPSLPGSPFVPPLIWDRNAEEREPYLRGAIHRLSDLVEFCRYTHSNAQYTFSYTYTQSHVHNTDIVIQIHTYLHTLTTLETTLLHTLTQSHTHLNIYVFFGVKTRKSFSPRRTGMLQHISLTVLRKELLSLTNVRALWGQLCCPLPSFSPLLSEWLYDSTTLSASLCPYLCRSRWGYTHTKFSYSLSCHSPITGNSTGIISGDHHCTWFNDDV